MTQSWQLRALALYLTLGVPLATSCAREANTLEDVPDDGSGATGTSGGSSSKAGSGGKAGSPSSAFGGTSSAGTSAGGKPGTAGSDMGEGGDSTTTAGSTAGGKAGSGGSSSGGSSGGSGGAAGTGGSGTTVPPDVLARASAVVYYQTSHTAASDKNIQMKLHIKNQSADPLPMANVKIRYWFTAEVATELHQYYTGPEAKNPKAVFVNDGANSHALLTFGGGSIVMGGDYNASEIQLEIVNNSSPFTQSDDFSFDASATVDKPNAKITLYLDDQLIWGCEPVGACFDDGAGGASGSGAGGAQ
jgi:hypothetical protein